MSENTSGNNVWSALASFGNAWSDVEKTKAQLKAQSMAAPAGKPINQQNTNIPPGQYGAFPQAQDKGAQAVMVGKSDQYIMWGIVASIVIAIVGLLVRK